MYYLHNRYYDPQVGRFISEDPAKDGTNWYAYCNGDSVNYVDPTGLWRTVALGYQAEYGDTLWGLSEKLFGNGSYWRDLGYPYDPQYERGLRVGDIIAYEGGLVEYENGQVNIRRSNILYQNGAYYTPAPMPEPPKPEPVKPAPPTAASTPKPNTGTTPKPSTSSPGNGGGGGNKGGSTKPNTGSGSIPWKPSVPKVSRPDPAAVKNYWIGAHSQKTVTTTTIEKKFSLLGVASVSYTQTVSKTIKNNGTQGTWFGVYAYEDVSDVLFPDKFDYTDGVGLKVLYALDLNLSVHWFGLGVSLSINISNFSITLGASVNLFKDSSVYFEFSRTTDRGEVVADRFSINGNTWLIITVIVLIATQGVVILPQPQLA